MAPKNKFIISPRTLYSIQIPLYPSCIKASRRVSNISAMKPKSLQSAAAAMFIATLPFLGGCEGWFKPRQPLHVSIANLDDQTFPDRRREGVNQIVDRKFGKRPPYVERYVQMAQNDTDFTVRAIAIRALNRSRYAPATPVFIHGLSDANSLVRLEAAKALNRLPDPAAIPLLIVHLQMSYETGNTDDRGVQIQEDESQDVRIASAEALGHYKTLDVARALVDELDTRDFGVAWEARNSLKAITGKDFAYNQAAWLNYLSSPGHTLG